MKLTSWHALPFLVAACGEPPHLPLTEDEPEAASVEESGEGFADLGSPDDLGVSTGGYSVMLAAVPEVVVIGQSNGDDPAGVIQVIVTDPSGRPAYVSADEVEWSSSAPDVVEVNDRGQLFGRAQGTAWIRAKALGSRVWRKVLVDGWLTSRTTLGRRYLEYRPSTLTASHAAVVAFHGGGGHARDQMNMSQMVRAASEHGFALAFPEGTGLLQTWNAGACCGSSVGTADDPGIRDVAFFRRVVAALVAAGADSRHIFVTGFSNGAMMSHRIACEAADLVAAVAPVSSGLNRGGDFPTCTPARPIPILMIHGATDRNVPYEGGYGEGYSGVDYFPIEKPPAPSTVLHWREVNGSSRWPSIWYASGDARCRYWQGDADTILCKIDPAVPDYDPEANIVYDGGGHAWPGGLKGPTEASDIPSHDLDATGLIWEFFSAHLL